jgi:hypothetical protein
MCSGFSSSGACGVVVAAATGVAGAGVGIVGVAATGVA